ncbi:hypothetical protein [Antarcticimicrobium luteum]|uniref:hypothetical protein n=1 Tax=Antarcticimicrobium luteum TaxID=2547397 RepID=UPI00140878E1|nr:hypothetical protein [Antarcticimicrobium luteum]
MYDNAHTPEIAASAIAERKAQAALKTLEEAWAYFTPEALPVEAEADPAQELFQYHAAA